MPVTGLKQVRFAEDLATVMGRECDSCRSRAVQGLDFSMIVRSQSTSADKLQKSTIVLHYVQHDVGLLGAVLRNPLAVQFVGNSCHGAFVTESRKLVKLSCDG